MRLSLVLYSPPRFHFWKHFGAGKKRRIPFYKHWWHSWRNIIWRRPINDQTLSAQQLPPNSRILNAEDFMQGPIDALPDEIIKMKNEKVVYDHPWPFNVKLDPIKNQELMYNYSIDTRFYFPRQDCQVLSNTIVDADKLEANCPIELTDEHLNAIKRQYEWATKNDSVLVRLPRKREWPKVNLKPLASYGISKERQEMNVMNSLNDFSQTLLAQHHKKQRNLDELNELLSRRSIAFPRCQVPFERDNKKINLDLTIDFLSIGDSPIKVINPNPESTRGKEPIDIHPRTWRSLIELTRNYQPNWCFSLPKNSYLHTIQLASRIIRDHRDEDEMLARSIIHAHGLTSQYARLRNYEKNEINRSGESKHSSTVLQDPLEFSRVSDEDLLERPIVLQTIGFELPLGNFHFMKYQLNTTKFDDSNRNRVKNQAWYSGPINDLREALRFYLDFQGQKLEILARDNQVRESVA